MLDMVTFPDRMEPVKRQRVEWGRNIAELLKEREWSRKHLIRQLDAVYGIEVSEASVAMWLKGDVSPRPDVQAGIAGLAGVPHHMLFPPVKLEKRVA